MVVEMLVEYGVSLLAATGLSLCLGGMISLRRNTLRRISELETHLNDMSAELKIVSNGAMGVGRKLQMLDQKTIKLDGKVTEIQKNDPNKVSYSEAARLVSMGAGIEDLMNACGISRPEAELVTALTKNKSKSEEESEDIIPQLNTRI